MRAVIQIEGEMGEILPLISFLGEQPTTTKMTTRSCVVCGREFLASDEHQRGREKIYCSPRCRNKAAYARKKQRAAS